MLGEDAAGESKRQLNQSSVLVGCCGTRHSPIQFLLYKPGAHFFCSILAQSRLSFLWRRSRATTRSHWGTATASTKRTSGLGANCFRRRWKEGDTLSPSLPFTTGQHQRASMQPPPQVYGTPVRRRLLRGDRRPHHSRAVEPSSAMRARSDFVDSDSRS